ncbi:MAG: hypothetical protein U0169_25920 [Polyangiaceae bacterium]
MTEHDHAPPGTDDEAPTDGDRDAEDSGPMKALLQRALAAPAEKRPTDMVQRVQKRIRERSEGKFYADGWSVSDGRIQYALVAGIMLVVLGVSYFVLAPNSFAP